jgi:hypothetical protein
VFVAAWVGIPLWLVRKRRHGRPDFSEARAYFRAKKELNQGESAIDAPPVWATGDERTPAGTSPIVPPRRRLRRQQGSGSKP